MTTAVKERPILFSGEMVRAILDGRKTATRRVVKPQPSVDAIEVFGWFEGSKPGYANNGCYYRTKSGLRSIDSPYEAGMHLWVRETFDPVGDPAADPQPHGKYESDGFGRIPVVVDYRADKPTRLMDRIHNGKLLRKWKPAIHMPRWASRITLEIESVRVERVQDITREEAIAEGCNPENLDGGKHCVDGMASELVWFMDLWNRLNERRGVGWDTNCYVWVLTFKRIQP